MLINRCVCHDWFFWLRMNNCQLKKNGQKNKSIKLETYEDEDQEEEVEKKEEEEQSTADAKRRKC